MRKKAGQCVTAPQPPPGSRGVRHSQFQAEPEEQDPLMRPVGDEGSSDQGHGGGGLPRAPAEPVAPESQAGEPSIGGRRCFRPLNIGAQGAEDHPP